MKTYSHSKINTFDQCRLKYKYRYIDKLRIKFDSIEAFMGKCVHEVLEEAYKQAKGNVFELPDMESCFESIWNKKISADVKVIKRGKKIHDYYDTGLECLRNYYAMYYPFDQSKTLGLEVHVQAQLGTQKNYRIQGYIDRLSLTKPGVYEVHDYKTSSSLPSQEVLDQDRQLALYELAIRQRFKDVEDVTLSWHYLAHKKTMVSKRSSADLNHLEVETVSKIEEIESAKTFHYQESPLCGWCEYQEICPAKNPQQSAQRAFDSSVGEWVDQLIALGAQKESKLREFNDLQEQMKVLMSKLQAHLNDTGQSIVEGKVGTLERVYEGNKVKFKVIKQGSATAK